MKCAKKYIDDTVAYRAALNDTDKSVVGNTKANLKKLAVIIDKTNKNSFSGCDEKVKEKSFRNIKTK